MSGSRWERFRTVGRMLFDLGYVDSHSGNLSERDGDAMAITRAGSMLGALEERDVVTVGIRQAGAMDGEASSELIVHRAVFAANPDVGAVVHAHVPHATAHAFHVSELAPQDSEGRMLLGGVAIPVVTADPPSGSRQAAVAVAKALKAAPAVLIRTHGLFAVAKGDLFQALKVACAVEHAARMLYLAYPDRFHGR